MTGIGTVLKDDAQLSVRHVSTIRQPLRVVLDSHLRIPFGAKILKERPLLIVAAVADSKKIEALEQIGVKVEVHADKSGQVDLVATLNYLASIGCNEVLVEAGSTLNGALLKANLLDELVLYLAPQLLGNTARGIAQLGQLESLDQRINLSWQDVRHVGKDLRIQAKVIKG
jgi:diaminohydroxyphosphoribosylaminopyrimidine deaminase/5-amino-6-(5-phosphoribosylamino)uracil reductase